MRIQAAVTHAVNAPFSIEELELEGPNTNEILVKIHAAGICHTDEAARSGQIPIPLPAVLGHEGAGIVEKVGDGVTEFAVGDPVVLTFGTCGICESCVAGRPYACEHTHDINFMGHMYDGTKRHHQGEKKLSCFFSQSSFASYAVVHQRNAVKIPKAMDLAVAAPLGCGIQTGAGIVMNQLHPEYGSKVAVFGCGTVGMSAIMAAHLSGCSKIIAVGGNQKSLDLAMQLGATDCINRKICPDLTQAILQISGPLDYAIDTSGVSSIIQAAYSSLCYTGILTLSGAGTEFVVRSGMGARRIYGTSEGHSVPKLFIPKLASSYLAGTFPLDRLITRFPFTQINEAFSASHGKDVIKAVLVM